MTDSNYPSSLDTDVELEFISDGSTIITASVINGLRSAVFAIEMALGVNPQGAAADVVTRLDTSLNADGTIKASALSSVGLVTLPIVNSMIGVGAGIDESKLHLDHTTASLYQDNAITYAFALATHNALLVDIFHLAQHTAHPSSQGRHRTSDIDGYLAPYSGQNAQGIVNDLYTRITSHVSGATAVHAASAISADDTNLAFYAVDVQAALEGLNDLNLTENIRHQDGFHSNAILKTQDVFSGDTAHSYQVVGSAVVNTITKGDTHITYTSPPIELAQVKRDDRVEIITGGNLYSFYVKTVNSSTGKVDFWGTMAVGGSGTATIYRNSEEVSEPSVLALTIRQRNVLEVGGAVIQMIHPNAPYILSSGIDLRKISLTAQYIRIQWASGNTDDLDIYTALSSAGIVPTGVETSHPGAWTVENLVIVLNNIFRAQSPTINHYPLIAFTYRGELGIALDEPTGFIEAIAPTGLGTTSAWSALGFAGVEKGYALGPRKVAIDGYSISAVKTLVNSVAATNGTDHIIDVVSDLDASGINPSGLVRVSNSGSDGSYIYDSYIPTILNIQEKSNNFGVDPAVNVKIYADTFSITVASIPSDRTFYELFADANGYNVELRSSERLSYKNEATSVNDPASWFEVVDVSRTFAATSNRRINITSSVVTMGGRGSGHTIVNPGAGVTLPATNGQGFRFKVYDGYGVDYVELEVIATTYTSVGANAIDVTIYDRISEERHLQLGTVLFDGLHLKNLCDRREFGNIGRKDVRDDFTRDYVTYPTSLLRNSGVIYGMGIKTSSVGTTLVSVDGGTVLIDGNVYSVDAISITVPNEASSLTYNLFVDSLGVLNLLEDNMYVSGVIYTPSVAEILNSTDKLLIGQVTVNASNQVLTVVDLRRFVNNLDNKVELCVENNSNGPTYGSFASLQSAINYLNLQTTAVGVRRIIRIMGPVDIAASYTIPKNTILEGDGRDINPAYAGAVLNFTNASGTILLDYGCTVRNLRFYSTVASSNGLISGPSGIGSNLIIENCDFTFDAARANNIAIKFVDATIGMNECIIQNNRFDNIYGGIVCDYQAWKTRIEGNKFNNVYSSAIWINDFTGWLLGVLKQDIHIKNNLFYTSSFTGAQSAFIKLLSPSGVEIDNNIFTCASTAAAAYAMVHIADQSKFVNITNNVFYNTNATGQGFKYGIHMDGAVTTHFYSNIIENTFLDFYGDAATIQTMRLINIDNAIIEGNKTFGCRSPIYAHASKYMNICTNNFNATGNSPAIYIDGVGSYYNNIVGNEIGNLDFPPSYHLVYLSGVEDGYGVIANNQFGFLRLVGLCWPNYSLLLLEKNGYIISNNIFRGDIFINASYSPLQINAKTCVAIGNQFSEILAAVSGTCIGRTANNDNVDILNKGQYYTVNIPFERSVPFRLENGLSSWATGSAGHVATTASYAAAPTANQVIATFDTTVVPVGATIINIKMLYTLLLGATTDFGTTWTRDRGMPPTISTIRPLTQVGATGALQTNTLTPAASALPVVMGANDVHKVYCFLANVSLLWAVYIHQFSITYKL